MRPRDVRRSVLVTVDGNGNEATKVVAKSRRRDAVAGVVSGVVAVAALVVGSDIQRFHSKLAHARLFEWLCVLVLAVAGVLAVGAVAVELGRVTTRKSVQSAGAVVRLVATGVGYIVVLFAAFAVLGVSLQRLLIGAGVAGVVLGIAAQQSLANIFASLVLLFARPFGVGDRIRIRSGTVGVLDAHVVGIGLTYVTVRTEDGILKIPNSVMLASGIGQLATPAEAEPLPPKPSNEASRGEIQDQ